MLKGLQEEEDGEGGRQEKGREGKEKEGKGREGKGPRGIRLKG